MSDCRSAPLTLNDSGMAQALYMWSTHAIELIKVQSNLLSRLACHPYCGYGAPADARAMVWLSLNSNLSIECV